MLFNMRIIFCFVLLGLTQFALGASRLSVSGNYSKSHLGLINATSRSISTGISLDLNNYFRIGYTYKEMEQKSEGYDANFDGSFSFINQLVKQRSHGLDVFGVLYAGKVFTPYVFLGLAYKYFDIDYERQGYPTYRNEYGPEISPNAGIGLAIGLTDRFGLKLNHAWSYGKSEDFEGNERREIDSVIEAGISYRL